MASQLTTAREKKTVFVFRPLSYNTSPGKREKTGRLTAHGPAPYGAHADLIRIRILIFAAILCSPPPYFTPPRARAHILLTQCTIGNAFGAWPLPRLRGHPGAQPSHEQDGGASIPTLGDPLARYVVSAAVNRETQMPANGAARSPHIPDPRSDVVLWAVPRGGCSRPGPQQTRFKNSRGRASSLWESIICRNAPRRRGDPSADARRPWTLKYPQRGHPRVLNSQVAALGQVVAFRTLLRNSRAWSASGCIARQAIVMDQATRTDNIESSLAPYLDGAEPSLMCAVTSPRLGSAPYPTRSRLSPTRPPLDPFTCGLINITSPTRHRAADTCCPVRRRVSKASAPRSPPRSSQPPPLRPGPLPQPHAAHSWGGRGEGGVS